MNKLTISLVAALSLLTVAGCKKKGGGAAEEALSKMEGFSKSMCDCKDKACADKVNDDMAKWGQEMAKTATANKDEKPDPELAKKSADVMTKYTECMTKLMMAGADMKGGDMKGGDMKGGDTKAEAKPDEAKKDEAAKPDEAKKDEPKKDDAAAKPDEAKKDEPKKDEPKKDEPKKDGAK